MKELVKRDLDKIWHPYTQMKDCEDMPPVPIVKAEGIKLYDNTGNFYYDTISSWWCNVHGHNHPYIKKAIKKQLDLFEHVLFAGFTHEPAIELAERLVKITPPGLDRVFFSDNGSTAVEVAMKMSVQYWRNNGKKDKTKIVALDKAYHGDTVGAMSVSAKGAYTEQFSSMLFDTMRVPTPYCYRCPAGKTKGECGTECLSMLESVLKQSSTEIAAVILEPVLMGAGGMIIYPAEYLKGAKSLTEKYDVHLIADEVATGFGRTGKMFACEHAGISPDIMCISKGITSGYLPLAATMVTQEIFDSFYGPVNEKKTFYHGHTYTANPVACAAANASIELFEKENTLKNVENIHSRLEEFLGTVSGLPFVGDTRSVGAVGAIELVKDKTTKEPFPVEERNGLKIYKQGLKHNILLRPLGDIIYFFLPLCVSNEELDDIFKKAQKSIIL
ncbi:MAG: adenosylmethionine--8-amino-7-oxononanoate transaminase [Candidatus Aadella gelida]|nr:adenosylmethionine--8-amino-7-oxononanoate transaminase [Candidatus Aadella gelida]